jgi:hypothetical protein
MVAVDDDGETRLALPAAHLSAGSEIGGRTDRWRDPSALATATLKRSVTHG